MAPSTKPSIGFVGLGLMGYGMATNLVKKGYSVHGYDISSKALERFEAEGGHAAPTLSESTKGNQYYICMVASAPQVQACLFDNNDAIVKSLPKGAVFFMCSTVPSTYAREVEEQLKKHGREDILFVDCPVSGGAKRAADGTLTIMAGGSKAALEKGKFLLQEMSDPRKLFICGGIGAGSNMKMVHQVLAGIQILAASEAMGFSSMLGADATKIRDAVIKSDGWSWMYENRVPRMLMEDYFPGASAVAIILKDVAIITRSALQLNFPTPLVSVAEQIYVSALTLGFEKHDDAGMVRTYYTHPISKVPEWSHPTAEEEAKAIELTVTLLKAIHLWAAAEAIAFAKCLNIDLDQFYELCVDAAGGSVMFEMVGPAMMKNLSGKAPSGEPNGVLSGRKLSDVVESLNEVVMRASKLQAPLHLGSAARHLMMLAMNKLGPDAADSDLVRFWEQQ